MTESTKKPIRILLVEDSEEDAFFLLRILDKANYSPTIKRVQTSSKLKGALQNERWDIVLCDNSMPGLTGRKAWELVRQDQPNLPFLFLSGADRAPEAPDTSGVVFVPKGNTGSLLSAIERILASRRGSPAEVLTPVRRSSSPTTSAESLKTMPKILIVDDRKENLDALEAILGSQGFPIVRARSGEETLEKLLTEDYALILLDVRMPGMGGLETAELLRKRARSRSVPIIFLTAGSGDPDEVARGYGVGCVDYLTKPFVPDILKAKVSVFLELSRQKAALERQAAELRSANESLDAFTASASHDLRAPLRSIEAFSRMLCEDYSGKVLDQPGTEYATRINQAAQRMNALTEDLLSFARLGRAEVRLEPVELTGLMDQLLEGVQDEIRLRKGRVQVHRPLGKVLGHPLLLRQALTNLVTNALKFAVPGQPPTVTIRSEARGKSLRILVEDRGIGISRVDQDRLFRPFVRTETAESYPGTGLGLAIVKKAVERMDGQVGVESGAGRGATFYIDLPCCSDEPL